MLKQKLVRLGILTLGLGSLIAAPSSRSGHNRLLQRM